MTHHNIVGSEADRTGPHVLVQEIPSTRKWRAVVWLHIAFGLLGLTAGVIDVFVLDAPVTIVPIIAAVLAWRFWPGSSR